MVSQNWADINIILFFHALLHSYWFKCSLILVTDHLKYPLLSQCRYQTNTANSILENIVNIQPKDSGGGGGETRESIVYKLANDMLEKLPVDYIPFEVSRVE